jgi:hypothetical protein
MTRVADSVSADLGDALPIQEEDIDSVFCNALEDHSSEHDFIPPANESPSLVSDQSCMYTE